MTSEIVDSTTTGNDLVLPLRDIRSGLFGAMTVEVSLEFGDTAKDTTLHELGGGHVVGIPATVCTKIIVSGSSAACWCVKEAFDHG